MTFDYQCAADHDPVPLYCRRVDGQVDLLSARLLELWYRLELS